MDGASAPAPPGPATDPGAPADIAAARAEARLALYVHVPFCARRCSYCDFSTGSLSSEAVERYLRAMALEAARRAGQASGRAFTSVFFGGGTPSALSARHFERLWTTLTDHFAIARDAEITLEANPESVREPLLEAWARAGVNRLSMGAQSFDPDELRLLGRIHDADRPASAAALARAAGFRRISFDLMFGFPGNDPTRWATTLERAIALEPEHLSAYCFIPEPGTPLGDAVARGAAALPSNEEQADAYAFLTERLATAGFACYETSNFCRPGGACRHNLVYWLRRPYLALGPAAHGYIDGMRYGNRFAMADWAAALERGDAPEAETEVEDDRSIAEEVMMLGLRLGDGLRASDYPERVWSLVRARYASAFERAVEQGRLELVGECHRIPAASRFVADDVIAWIEAEADRPRFDSSSRRFIPSGTCRNLHSLVA